MEENILNTSLKLGEMNIGDKKPLSDVTNTPNLKDGRSKEISPNQDEQAIYNKLITKAKQYTGDGQVRKAMELNKEALKICYSEKLAKKVAKMESYLKEYGEDSDDDDDEEESGIINVGNGFHLYKDLYNKLYSHQKEGILWMWALNKRKKGGILGDDMGLGKTIQVIAFLSGMFDMEKAHYILIVMPVALVVNWENEFNKWAPGINVTAYHGTSKRERERSLAKVQRRGGVCITTYGMVVTSWEQLGKKDGREFSWDYMILDEGHKIKNPTKTTKGVYNIPARNRLILTGTPIQNNLRELWALFDFVHHGTLLGTAKTFKMEFDTPIIRSREKDATVHEKRLGSEMSEALKKIIAPYFLRRTKAEVTAKNKKDAENTIEESTTKSVKMPNLTRKNELVIWLFLTPTQQKIYKDFLELDSIKELLMTTKSPLVALTVLKKLCDHPRLLSTRQCAQLGLDGHDEMDEEMLEAPEAYLSAATKIQHIEDHVLIQESGKLIVLVQLLDNLKSEGHRCLVFSQSRKMLDIIQKLITNRGHKIMRLDGTVTQVADREQRIQKFQKDDRYSVFLLTTQVGGVGLTLTAADRVVIYDPSWNPATDAQAVDRVFRIGQDKNVVIYRLITCASIEEKIYRRQIFKDSITRQTTGNSNNPYRYFTKQDLRELFTLENPQYSATQQQLQEMHTTDRRSDLKLDAHIAFLHSLDIFGISDHDLMFSQEVSYDDDEEEEDNNNPGHIAAQSKDYIQSRIQRAQQLIEMESSVPQDFNERFNDKKSHTQFNDRPMAVPAFKPNKPSNTNTMFNRPRVIDNDTIDLTLVSSPFKSTSPSSPITIDDENSYEKPVTKTEINIKTEADTDYLNSYEKPVTKTEINIKTEADTEFVKHETSTICLKEERLDSEASNSSDNGLNDSCDRYPGNNSNTDSSTNYLSDHASLSLTKDSCQTVIPQDTYNHHHHHHNGHNISNTNDLCSNIDCVTSDGELNDEIQNSNDNLSAKSANFASPQAKLFRETVNNVVSPFKIPEDPIHSPSLRRTPKRKERIIEEQLIISPDSGSPLLSFQPRSNVLQHLRMSANATKLNMSILGRSPDSPYPNRISPPTSSELQTTVVENSLSENSFESPTTCKTVVSNSPILPNPLQKKPIRNILDNISVSIEDYPLVESKCTSLIKDSFNESVEEMNEDLSLVTSRTSESTQQRKNIIASSDEGDDDSDEDIGNRGHSRKKTNVLESEEEDINEEVVGASGEDAEDNDVNNADIVDKDNDIVDNDDIVDSGDDDIVDSGDDDIVDSGDDDVENSGDDDSEFIDDGVVEDDIDVKDTDDKVNGVDEDDDDYGGSFIDDEEEEDDSGEESASDDDGFDDLPEDLKLKFNECVEECRVQYKAKNYELALTYILQGLEIFPDPDLQQQALKIHSKISK